ncbi:hypothetical protein QW71_19225 [Paenibacillus sp. IHB B 3415]|uniref:hypothetical protein n=1 Tax=Paenibacillus sp. IHB B 3415 TaxID=867080 RepID=UPI000573C3ED|nr:hypothetical protein [Paenibacillus sp. IHB B 3415]KHL94189.1 hypothetical protein QW71_19225 [Paenibacillus sp. IHB B 3415]
MEIVDLTLITLETIAFIAFTAYVIRYRRYFMGRGPLRTYNLYLRSVWVTYGAVALLCLNLLWGRLNIILGYNTDGSLSGIMREYVLILTLVMLVFAGWMHKELWDSNRREEKKRARSNQSNRLK